MDIHEKDISRKEVKVLDRAYWIKCDDEDSRYAGLCHEMLEGLEYIKDDLTSDEAWEHPNEIMIAETVDNFIPNTERMIVAVWESDEYLWDCAQRKGYINNFEYDSTIDLMRIDIYTALKDEAEYWHYINFQKPKEVQNVQ